MSRENLNLKLENGYKEKLKEIAEKNQRSMTGQIQYWIDQVKNSE
jgi:hypothetical protein